MSTVRNRATALLPQLRPHPLERNPPIKHFHEREKLVTTRADEVCPICVLGPVTPGGSESHLNVTVVVEHAHGEATWHHIVCNADDSAESCCQPILKVYTKLPNLPVKDMATG